MNDILSKSNQALGSLLKDLAGCSVLYEEAFWKIVYSVYADVDSGRITPRSSDDITSLFKRLVIEKALNDADLQRLLELAVKEAITARQTTARVIVPGYLALDFELSQNDYPKLMSSPITKPFGMKYVEYLKNDAIKSEIDVFVGPTSPFEHFEIVMLKTGDDVNNFHQRKAHLMLTFLCLYDPIEWEQNQIEAFIVDHNFVDVNDVSLSKPFRQTISEVNKAGKSINGFQISTWNTKDKYRLMPFSCEYLKIRVCITPLLQAYFGRLLSSKGIFE